MAREATTNLPGYEAGADVREGGVVGEDEAQQGVRHDADVGVLVRHWGGPERASAWFEGRGRDSRREIRSNLWSTNWIVGVYDLDSGRLRAG